MTLVLRCSKWGVSLLGKMSSPSVPFYLEFKVKDRKEDHKRYTMALATTMVTATEVTTKFFGDLLRPQVVVSLGEVLSSSLTWDFYPFRWNRRKYRRIQGSWSVVREIRKVITLLPAYCEGVKKVINAVSIIVDTPDRARYK
uniref:Rossmann-fold NAD(P)-binding domain protein n=1 Tax=Tanacetum cinerariifolium TaxID=118510 RepID=A0A6L2ME63_TANCI|nr:Rossmann-fold NAD(P)-binding domain protein [Tanacetum cinerariifolium]